jgi:hypothetical protein
MSSVLDALGYPGRCLSSTSALSLSKDFLLIQTCFLNILLSPCTLLTSNEFQCLRHFSHANRFTLATSLSHHDRRLPASEVHCVTSELLSLLLDRYVFKFDVG